MITVKVDKKNNESSSSVLRRFSKRAKSSGVIGIARGKRYSERTKSELKKKKDALKKLTRKAEYERLVKLGKVKSSFF